MLSLTDTIILSLVQGITEFLPVSSSGHLALLPTVFGFDDPGLAFGATLHIGTLLAVLWYFRDDLLTLCKSLLPGSNGLSEPERSKNRRLVVLLATATVPAAVAGFLWEDVVANALRSPSVIAGLLVAGSVFLYLADKCVASYRTIEEMTLRDALGIGLLQAAAVVPGVSRSGATMAMGRLLGLTREAATRFSFLLAIPVILGATLLELPRVMERGLSLMALVGVGVSFLVAYATIALFLKFVQKVPFAVFVWYSVFVAAMIVFFV